MLCVDVIASVYVLFSVDISANLVFFLDTLQGGLSQVFKVLNFLV
jgi:hypothetical protein